MLWFEREVVGALVQSGDPDVRSAVEAFVDGSLRDMPEPIRLGVVGESLVLGAYAAGRRAVGGLDTDDLARLLAAWETSRVGVVRQYVRMMKSLVVFAENELTPAAAPAPAPAGTA
jgi:hypothetical protein